MNTADDISARDTHLIQYRAHNTLLADSSPLGWGFAYASLVSESPWDASVPAIPHIGLAFNLRNPTQITRVMGCNRDQDTAWLHPHQFSVLPADAEVHWHIHGDPNTLLLYVNRKVFESVASTIFDADPDTITLYPRLAYSDPLVASLCLEFVRALHQPSQVYDKQYMELVTHQLVACLIKNHSNFAEPPVKTTACTTEDKLEQAKAFMRHNLSRDISLDTIATAADMSSYHFIREFKARHRLTPYQYLIKLRVEHAQHLLGLGRDGLADIALACGFSNQSHFTNVFKKFTGLTPSAYRDA